MTDRTNAERQRRRRERDRANGLIAVLVKVPAEKAEDIKRIAAQMREDAKGESHDR